MSEFEKETNYKMLYRILFLEIFNDYFEWIYPDKNLTQLRKEYYGKGNFQQQHKEPCQRGTRYSTSGGILQEVYRISYLNFWRYKDLQSCLAFQFLVYRLINGFIQGYVALFCSSSYTAQYKWIKVVISVATRDVQENLCQELDIILTFSYSQSKRCNTEEEFVLREY